MKLFLIIFIIYRMLINLIEIQLIVYYLATIKIMF